MTTPTPRGILPDAVDDERFYLVKACSSLRLTYEIRLATFLALENGKRLCLLLQPHTALLPDLEAFVQEHAIELDRGAQ